jgi:hypothetical protein
MPDSFLICATCSVVDAGVDVDVLNELLRFFRRRALDDVDDVVTASAQIGGGPA